MAKPKKSKKVKIADLISKVRMVIFDFDGVFTDNRVFVLEDGKEGVFCSRGDSWGLALLKKTGLLIRVISTETNLVVTARCKKLDVPCIQACSDKLETLKKEAELLKLDLNQIAYLGNDTNDLECLKAVGFSACVRDAHPSILKIVKYVTKKCGGYGAVRDFCDLIIRYKNEKLS